VTAERPPLKPTRDPRVTLDDLVEVLLNKGAVLHLDLIVAVADIPLIGVSLRAAIAGMETMLEYGMMRQWDEDTRAWAERSAARRALDLRAGEQVLARMPGGHLLEDDTRATWRPGTVHLTDQRLVVLRRDPREVLWQAELAAVRAVRLETERTVGGEPRTRVRVHLADGPGALLSAADPGHLRDLLARTCPAPLALDSPGSARPLVPGPDDRALVEGHLWYHEPRRDGPLWRGGHGRITPAGLVWKSPLDSPGSARPLVPGPDDRALVEGHLWYHEPRRDGPLWRGGHGRITPAGLVWKSPLDARPALVVPAARIIAAHPGTGHGPGGEGTALTVETDSHGTLTLAADDPHRWAGALRSLSGSPPLPAA